MQRFAFAAIVLAGCFTNPEIEVDRDSVDIPRGTYTDVTVYIDGVAVHSLDEILWTVDNERMVSVTRALDGRQLRIGGEVEGETTVHVFAYGHSVPITTHVGPPAVVRLWTEPTTVHATIGSQVELRAKALDTTATITDVTSESRWSVRDDRIVNLDSDGMMLQAMSAGETTLHVLHDGVNAVVPVTVLK